MNDERGPAERGAKVSRTRPDPLPVIVAAVPAAVVVFAAALLFGGGLADTVPGIDDPGPITGWGLPLAKLALDLAAVLTIGSLLFAVIAPSKRGLLRDAGQRAVRTASNGAWVWTVAAALTLVFTVSDFAGTPPQQTDYRGLLSMVIAQTAQGRALTVVVVLAVVVAAASRTVRSLNGVALTLVLAIATLVPPPLTGHSASAENHDIATSSLLVHVVAVTLWVGGLLALLLYGRTGDQASERIGNRSGTSTLRAASGRYSQLALWCFVAAGVSGVLNSWVRLSQLADLWQTRYGWLLVGKLVALVVLGVFGFRHRRHTLSLLDQGRPRAFGRLAVGEVLVMAATFGLAVALSRTPPPVPEDESTLTGANALIGYEVPPFEPGNLLTLWRPDSISLLAATLGITLYILGLRRLRRSGIPWSFGHTIAWFLGVAVAVFVLNSGVATYAPAMFSVHMVQHMVLSMLVPILLAMGAPVTLALRALPARPALPEDRTARGWILEVVHSRLARVVTNPAVALALYVGTLYAFYFSPLFGWAMSTHELHLVMLAHFLLVGLVYFWPIIALDPMPRKLPPVGRMLLLFSSMPFHAFFGVIVMMSATVIGASWYSRLRIGWVDPLTDQNVGGGIAWGAAELPVLVVMGVVFVSWWRSDQRAARRADRSGAAEWEAYNAELARLAERGR